MSLPNELIDSIVDNLHDDRPSQLACTLVSRTFLASSRYHLFGRICLRPWERKWDPDLRKGSLMSFLLVAPYIRYLTIDWDDGETSFPGDNGVVFDILPVISTHLGVPTFLSLLSVTHYALRMDGSTAKHPNTCIPTLLGSTGTASLKELHFEYCTLPSIHALACATASCITLEKLTTHFVGWKSVCSPLSGPPTKLPYRLRTFGYHGFCDSHSIAILQWISAQYDLPVIDPLDLIVRWSEVFEISSLIRNWGGSLKSLKLDFSLSREALASFSSSGCLRCTPIMQSLHLILPYKLHIGSDDAPVHLSSIIASLNVGHPLKNLIFEFSSDAPDLQDPSPKWAELADLLLGFTQLEMIGFKAYLVMGESSQNGLREIFRPFASRGTLQFINRNRPW